MVLPLQKNKGNKKALTGRFFVNDLRRYVVIGHSPMGYSSDEVDHG